MKTQLSSGISVVLSTLMIGVLSCRGDDQQPKDEEFVGVAGVILGPAVGTGTVVLDANDADSKASAETLAAQQDVRKIMELPEAGKFRLILENKDSSPAAIAAPPSSQSLKLLNAGKSARLVDQAGKVLYDASEGESPLLSIKLSTDGGMVLLDSGDAGISIYQVDPFKRIGKPPAKAPVPDGSAFTWEWLDGTHLVGLSSTSSPQEALAYVYDVNQALLTHVEMKDPQIPKNFKVKEHREGGHFLIEADIDGKGIQQRWVSVK